MAFEPSLQLEIKLRKLCVITVIPEFGNFSPGYPSLADRDYLECYREKTPPNKSEVLTG